MFGGYSGTSRVADLYRYDFRKECWLEVPCLPSTPWPGARENNGVLICSGTSVYVFGGYNGNVVLQDFYRLPVASGCDEFEAVRRDYRRLMEEGVKDPEVAGSGDVFFKVGSSGRLVRGNRGILKARSSYFRQMFNSGMIESNSGKLDVPIVISDVSHGVFLVVLEYLYTGTMEGGEAERGAVWSEATA